MSNYLFISNKSHPKPFVSFSHWLTLELAVVCFYDYCTGAVMGVSVNNREMGDNL